MRDGRDVVACIGLAENEEVQVLVLRQSLVELLPQEVTCLPKYGYTGQQSHNGI